MPETGAARPEPMAEPINVAQRKAIFAAANARGLSIDDIRALTPEGSISRLSYRQAYDLLVRLNGRNPEERHAVARHQHRPRGPRRPKGVFSFVTIAQRNMIRYFREHWGWSEKQLSDWLAQRHYRRDPSRSMGEMNSSADAQEVIELLKYVDSRMEAAAKRRGEPARCQMPRGHSDEGVSNEAR